MEESIIIKDISGWINVLDYGICNDETKDVSFKLQEIMDAVPEDSIIYFPKENTYLKVVSRLRND